MSIIQNIVVGFCLFYAVSCLAENEDFKPVIRLDVQGGQVVREKQEIEVYDYHSGSHFSVFVYRETEEPKPENPPNSRSTSQVRP